MRILVRLAVMRSVLRVTLFLVLAVGPARADDPGTMIQIMGLGTVSCATWLQTPTNKTRGEQWVFGFFSGANEFSAIAGENGMVSESTDQPGLIAEVKKICDEEPSKLLIDAAATVYFSMRKAGR